VNSSRGRLLKQPDFLKQFKENMCPAVYLLGTGDIRLSRLRQFRDMVLAKNSAGEKLIKLYYFNGKRITALFDYSPAIKDSAKKLLELSIPIVEFLLAF
jgi:hypothetical protein